MEKRVRGKTLLAGSFTLIGTIIGAGILGLPYVFAKSGFLIGVFWLLILGALMLFVHLYMGEVMLRTHGNHQLTGYAEKYLGKFGKWLMVFAMVFGIYAALIAYLIGEGQSLSYVIFGSGQYAIIFGILFWLAMTLLLREGLRGLKKVESYGVFLVLIIIIGIFFYFFPNLKAENLSYNNWNMFFVPMGVVLFSLLGFSAIPEVGRVMEYHKSNLKKALIIGSVVPIIAYLLFTLAFVGAFGIEVKEVATLSSGRLIGLLGVFTMTTSFFVLSFALRDMFKTDLKINKRNAFILVSILPLALYLLISFFNLLDFKNILGIGGVVSGGLTGILILLMNYQSKKYSERKPEYWLPINWLVILIISLLLIGAIILELGLIK
ncbi:MAG: aromatic amino acid transport family protein [Candidatus Pacearchaeota archaeon]|jgi:amino acid permease